MTSQTDLEIKGSFFAHPFAELLAEIAHARLNGSLRISAKEKKCVVYFAAGRVVFAVSNARTSRLYDILLRRNKLTKEDLVKIPNFSNDLEFAVFLQNANFLSKTECDRLFTDQIEGILVDALAGDDGNWIFSSLARVRDGLSFDINTSALLVDYGRCLSVENMLGRFRSLDESFVRSDIDEHGLGLKPEEAFVLSRADEGDLSASTLVSVAAMSESAALHAIYTLWLAGLLVRRDWQAAFSSGTITAMKTARIQLKQEAKQSGVAAPAADHTDGPGLTAGVKKEPEKVVSLEEYLKQVESAATHYDILNVDVKADNDELKRAYFSLARMFHPDRFHVEGGETLKRVQHAFTQLAQAHETLKAPESREVYDYRMRKELTERERREAAGETQTVTINIDQAREHFDRGFSALMDEDYETAMPALARAVHFDPKNARYHAYFGKALSSDPRQRHKAESEMQAALRIDPNNPTFRILLAEFFIQNNLKKRAEGELNRLLAVFPSNREARELLASLK